MITDLIRSSNARLDGYRDEADLTVKLAATSMSRRSDAMAMLAGGGNSGSALPMFDQSHGQASRQYSYFRDVPYAAIRPIAVKIADLSLHVGEVQRKRRSGGKGGAATGFRTKHVVPDFVKAMSGHVESIDGHEFIEDILDPNPYMTHWAMMYCTVVSMYVTGRSYWWMNEDPDGGTQFWYLPSTWVTPIASKTSPIGHYEVNPPWATGAGWTVPDVDMCYFSLPDPANPLASYAPLQSQARAVDTDDMVQEAQLVTMRDGVQPKTIITVGKTPEVAGIPGSGERIEITADQRKQLINEVMTWYAGASKRGLPFVVDRKIEKIEPFGRSAAELDFVNGAKLTSDRVHHGLGVNRIITGMTEGANRASAIVADTYFYALVVNPLGTHMSQTMTKEIGPRYSDDRKRTVIWIERAEAKDPALVQGRMKTLIDKGAVTIGEARSWATTGDPDLPQRDDDDELIGGGKGEQPQAGGVPAGDSQGGSADGKVQDGGQQKSAGDVTGNGDELDWILKGVEIGKRQAVVCLIEKGNQNHDAQTGQFSSGGGGGATPQEQKAPRTKSEIAKASMKITGKEIQRYAEDHNEPVLAAAVGGESLDDNEPIDVNVEIDGMTHGIELKTMVTNTRDQISMSKEAKGRKRKWERGTGRKMHTVVFDDREVYNANGPGKHDESKRKILYKRGFGSFSTNAMHEVSGMSELTKLMTSRRDQIPKSAGGTKGVKRKRKR